MYYHYEVSLHGIVLKLLNELQADSAVVGKKQLRHLEHTWQETCVKGLAKLCRPEK